MTVGGWTLWLRQSCLHGVQQRGAPPMCCREDTPGYLPNITANSVGSSVNRGNEHIHIVLLIIRRESYWCAVAATLYTVRVKWTWNQFNRWAEWLSWVLRIHSTKLLLGIALWRLTWMAMPHQTRRIIMEGRLCENSNCPNSCLSLSLFLCFPSACLIRCRHCMYLYTSCWLTS